LRISRAFTTTRLFLMGARYSLSRASRSLSSGSEEAFSQYSAAKAAKTAKKNPTMAASTTMRVRLGLIRLSGTVAQSNTWIELAATFASSIFIVSYCFSNIS